MDVKAPIPHSYVFEHFRLDPARLSLTRNGVLVPTTPRVFSALLYLVENSGRTIGKEEMLRALWPGRIAEETNLSQAISAVRRMLATAGQTDACVVTVPGQGYRFTAVVTVDRPEAEAALALDLAGMSDARGLGPTHDAAEPTSGKPALAPQLLSETAGQATMPDSPRPAPAVERAAGPSRMSRLPRLQWAVMGLMLALVLAVGGARLFSRRSPAMQRDPLAAELYREGLHDWNLRTPASLARAVDEFTQAIVREPNSAQAYIGLARCYDLLREYSDMPDAEAYPRAEAATERAIAIDPAQAAAHSSLAFIRYYWNWDAAGAETEFRRAISLDPKDAVTRHWYANVLRVELRSSEALQQITEAQALDPDSSTILADKGAILISMGRVSDGERILRRLEMAEPQQLKPHAYLAALDLQRRDYRRFLAESKLAAEIRHDGVRLQILKAAEEGLASGGDRGMLTSMLDYQRRLIGQRLVAPYAIASTYALLGDRNNTLYWLEASMSQHDDSILGALVDPYFSFVHDDPRFSPLRATITGARKTVVLAT